MFFFDFLILLVFFCCMGCERTTEKIIRDLNCKSAIETENGKTMDEELSEEELLHFNKMFFTQSQEENPYVRCLTSLYHDPKDMNIFLAFYGGSDSAKVTDENERERVMGAYNQEGTLLKISKTKMNEFLMRYIGLPVDETNKNGIELFEYDSGNYYYQTDFYPESRLSTTFLRGEHTDNKVRLYYYASDLNLADVQECSVACVTLEKNEQGYQIISNVLIPIPMYLDGPPNKVIPLQMETFLELPLLSKAPLAEDCVCWYAKKDVGPYTVCVYRILDGRLCVGFLQDETTWSTSAFRFLPDSACGIGFGVDACSNLLGSQGIVLSYNDKGNAITEYYLLKDNFFRRDAYARTYACLSAYLPTIDIWNEYKNQNPETLEKPWNTLRKLYQDSNPDISDLTAAIPYTVFPSGLLCHHGRNISFCHDNYRDFFAAFHIANVVYGLYSGIDLAALSPDAQEVFLLQLETLDNSILFDAISILRQYFGLSIYDISAQDTTDLSDTCAQIALPAILIRLLDAVIRRGELSKNEHSQLCQLRSTLCERFVLSFKALDESDPLQTKYCLFFSLALSMLARDYRTGVAGTRDLIKCAGYAQQCINGEKKLNRTATFRWPYVSTPVWKICST